MMNEFDEIGKQMPYSESEDYLKQVINKSAETAVQRHKPTSRMRRLQWIAAAASIVIAASLGLAYLSKTNHTHNSGTVQVESPLDEYLNSISDDDAQLIEYYEIEEIPEY